MLNKIYLVLLLALSFTLSCQNEKTSEGQQSLDENAKTVDLDKMAATLCECMQPLFDVQAEINTLRSEGKNQELQALLKSGKLQELTQKGEDCVDLIEAEYGEIPESEEQNASAAFKRVCPKAAEVFNKNISQQ